MSGRLLFAYFGFLVIIILDLHRDGFVVLLDYQYPHFCVDRCMSQIFYPMRAGAVRRLSHVTCSKSSTVCNAALSIPRSDILCDVVQGK
jgi:hypothetical protein